MKTAQSPKSERFELRIDPHTKAYLLSAAEHCGQSLADYLIEAGVAYSTRLIARGWVPERNEPK